MDTLATIAPAQPLANFSTAFLSQHKEHWPPDEGTLAHEFTEQFPIRQLSNPESIIAFSKNLGIDASLGALPDVMHGFNCSLGEQNIILLREQETIRTIRKVGMGTHTLETIPSLTLIRTARRIRFARTGRLVEPASSNALPFPTSNWEEYLLYR